jgi:hypothetical protein
MEQVCWIGANSNPNEGLKRRQEHDQEIFTNVVDYGVPRRNDQTEKVGLRRAEIRQQLNDRLWCQPSSSLKAAENRLIFKRMENIAFSI